jgi:hypothetical protein
MPTADLETFLARWSQGEGGQERANYALFLTELCDLLDVPRPDQATHEATANTYAFERGVTFLALDGSAAHGRIDLYRRGQFDPPAALQKLRGILVQWHRLPGGA